MPHTQNTRDRILRIAAEVFYQHGYRATGVDAVAKAAGITKATLYHHFKDKEELIEESLRFLSQYHRGNYVKAWNKKGLSPKRKLTVLFDEMHQAFKSEDFFGCPFINASGEYPERESRARKVCEEHYQYLIAQLEIFAREAGLTKPREVAESIASLIAGGYTSWFVGGVKNAAIRAKKTAELVIAQHSVPDKV
jgi:AcrR family transcriptional regulator